MMADDKLTSGEAYSFVLLEEWKNVLILSKSFENNYLNGRCDALAINEHIGTMATLYDALSPMVHSHNGEKDWTYLISEFDSWKQWADNTLWFQSSMEAIKDFRRMLAAVVDKLDITYFPKARKG
jgi:hypothetical protein